MVRDEEAPSVVTTYHGEFTTAEGWRFRRPAPDATDVEHVRGLVLEGTWTIALATGADAARVTGRPIVRSSRRRCGCPGTPCGSPRLGGAHEWTLVGETAATLQLTRPFTLADGSLFLTYDLVLNKVGGSLTVTMPIEDRLCPEGWKTLILHGEVRS